MNKVFVGNTSRFENKIDLASLEGFEGNPQSFISSSPLVTVLSCLFHVHKNDVQYVPMELDEKVENLQH